MEKLKDESYISYIKRITNQCKDKKITFSEWGDYILGDENVYSDDNCRKGFYIVRKILDRLDDNYEVTDVSIQLELDKLKDVVWNLNWIKTGGGNCDVGFELYRGFYYLENDTYIMNESLLLAKRYLFEQLYKQYQEGYNIVSTEKPTEVFIDVKDFHSKTFRDYAYEILSIENTKDRFDVLNSIYNSEWKTYLSYGIEKNKIHYNLFEAKKFYETKDKYKI